MAENCQASSNVDPGSIPLKSNEPPLTRGHPPPYQSTRGNSSGVPITPKPSHTSNHSSPVEKSETCPIQLKPTREINTYFGWAKSISHHQHQKPKGMIGLPQRKYQQTLCLDSQVAIASFSHCWFLVGTVDGKSDRNWMDPGGFIPLVSFPGAISLSQ